MHVNLCLGIVFVRTRWDGSGSTVLHHTYFVLCVLTLSATTNLLAADCKIIPREVVLPYNLALALALSLRPPSLVAPPHPPAFLNHIRSRLLRLQTPLQTGFSTCRSSAGTSGSGRRCSGTTPSYRLLFSSCW